jgi:uncharacterized protein with NAD-binding domain and iron-sulfur cluster
MNNKIKINIYGAGISGLITAFELSKYKEFDITIYEKSDSVGGMSKSKYINNIPSEHSWRGYSNFYFNLIDILKQIPIEYICDIKKGGNSIKKYSIDDISKHNKSTDFWCYYRNNVYNLTEFVKNHPGGSIILKSAGKDLEEVWSEFGFEWHNNNKNVMNILKQYKIGELVEKEKKNNFKSYENSHINHSNHEHFKNYISAFENLKEIEFKLLFNKEHKYNYIKFFNLPFQDLIYLGYKFVKTEVVNLRKKNYYKQKFKNILDKTSEKSQYYFGYYICGPGAGFDLNTISYMSFSKFIMLNVYQNFSKWNVMNKPTNEAWINPLTDILIKNNVQIKFNNELNKINYKNNLITNCIVNNKSEFADIHIFATDPFNFESILNISKIENNYDMLNTINNQISFRIGFNKDIKFNISENSTGFVLMDSPFNITFYCQSDDWCKNIKFKNKIKTLISGTIIMPYNEGLLFKKSALSHNLDELKKEIIEQFIASNDFLKQIKKYNNFEIKRSDFNYVEIYDDYYFDKKSNMLKTKNKKWVNNFINDSFRPNYKTQFKNSFIVGSHCKTTVDVWSMEGAAESAKEVSNIILTKFNFPNCYIYNHNKKNLFINIITKIDDILVKLNLPHIFDFIIILCMIAFCIKLYK